MNDIDDAMYAWLRACANPTLTEVVPAVVAGLLIPSEGPYRYVTTDKGRAWLIKNAIINGASAVEAEHGVDYLDGVS